MKTKTFKILFILTLVYHSMIAQVKQGKIIYQISYLGSEISEQQKAMMPSQSVCYFANNNSRTESDGFMGMKMVTLCVNEEITMLMDVMGKRIAMHPKDATSTPKSKEPQITYSEEVRTIAGYACKKAVLNFDNTTKMTVWCTEDISGGGSWGGSFAGIKGAPLEYTADLNGISMKMTATKVTEEKVSKKKFEIPSGYEFMTSEQLQKQFK